jgi:hypothetical protein
MPSESEGFRGVSLKADVVDAIEKFIEEHPTYRSVAEFVSEAVRLRMEQVRKGRGKGA